MQPVLLTDPTLEKRLGSLYTKWGHSSDVLTVRVEEKQDLYTELMGLGGIATITGVAVFGLPAIIAGGFPVGDLGGLAMTSPALMAMMVSGLVGWRKWKKLPSVKAIKAGSIELSGSVRDELLLVRDGLVSSKALIGEESYLSILKRVDTGLVQVQQLEDRIVEVKAQLRELRKDTPSTVKLRAALTEQLNTLEMAVGGIKTQFGNLDESIQELSASVKLTQLSSVKIEKTEAVEEATSKLFELGEAYRTLSAPEQA